VTVTQPTDELSCELKVRSIGTRLGLAFMLANRSASAKTVRYFHPFLQFELQITADGQPVRLTQPDIDIPSQPRELQLAAGATAALDTPISLRFASEPAVDASSMVWTIEGSPRPIELRATLHLASETVAPCSARVER